MKNLRKYLLILFVPFVILSCEETNPERITGALFSDEGAVETPNIEIDHYLTFDTGQDGYANWGEYIGFDIYVQNLTEKSLTDIEVQVAGVTPSYNYYDHESLESAATISTLSAYNYAKPTKYWCYRCNEFDEQYIGNFMFQIVESHTGTSTLTLEIEVEYYDGNRYRTESFSREFTIY